MLLLFLLLSYYPFKKRDGSVIVLLMVCYGIHRFLNEMLRIDNRAQFDGLTFSQNVSILVLIAAAGITSIRPKWLGLILCAAISAASFTGIAAYYDRDFDTNRDDWLGTTSFVLDRAQPHDGVFFFHRNGHAPFEFYRSQREFPQPWPEALQGQGRSELTGQDFKYRGIDRELASAKPAGDRIWLVLNYDADFFGDPHHSRDTARAVFGHGRHLIESQDFGVITVLLYARDETGVPPP